MKKERILRLGYSALNDWESLMIKEKVIDSFDSVFNEKKFDVSTYNISKKNKDFLLFAMVLFDKIDASCLSMFNMDRLIEQQVISEHANMIE